MTYGLLRVYIFLLTKLTLHLMCWDMGATNDCMPLLYKRQSLSKTSSVIALTVLFHYSYEWWLLIWWRLMCQIHIPDRAIIQSVNLLWSNACLKKMYEKSWMVIGIIHKMYLEDLCLAGCCAICFRTIFWI